MRIGKSSAESLPKTSGFDSYELMPGVRVISLDLSNVQSMDDLVKDFLRQAGVLDTLNLSDILDRATKTVSEPEPSAKLEKIFGHVHNGCSPETEKFLVSTIQELGMNMKNVGVVFTRHKSAAGQSVDGRMILYVDESLDFNSRKFVILHELRHIQQIQRGWLIHGASVDGSIYKGRHVKTNPNHYESNLAYCMAPHELDANIFALTYFDGDADVIHSGENAIGIAKEYIKRNQWLESIGVP